jgi:hypothetical protein
MEIILIQKPAISEAMCAASVRIANEPEISPPAISVIINKKQIIKTHLSLAIAEFPFRSFF